MSLPVAVTLTLTSTTVFGMRVSLVALVSMRVAQEAGAVAQGSGVWAIAGEAISANSRAIRACMGILSVLLVGVVRNDCRTYDGCGCGWLSGQPRRLARVMSS